MLSSLVFCQSRYHIAVLDFVLECKDNINLSLHGNKSYTIHINITIKILYLQLKLARGETRVLSAFGVTVPEKSTIYSIKRALSVEISSISF